MNELKRQKILVKVKISRIQQQIDINKSYLSSTDYQAIKVSEGVMTSEEYAPIKAKRQEARAAINAAELEIAKLEAQLANL